MPEIIVDTRIQYATFHLNSDLVSVTVPYFWNEVGMYQPSPPPPPPSFSLLISLLNAPPSPVSIHPSINQSIHFWFVDP